MTFQENVSLSKDLSRKLELDSPKFCNRNIISPREYLEEYLFFYLFIICTQVLPKSLCVKKRENNKVKMEFILKSLST